MILIKDGMKKDLSSPKVIARWKRFGWVEADEYVEKLIEETPVFVPKRRGRQAKKED